MQSADVYLLCCVHMAEVFQYDQEMKTEYLNNKNVLSGVLNWETESLIPLRGSGPITHLQNERIDLTSTKQMTHFKLL